MQETLQDLRKMKFQTVKAFAQAYGCTPRIGSATLNGGRHMVMTRAEIRRLADLLGVSFGECVLAANYTFALSHSTPFTHDAYWSLEIRWRREERDQQNYQQWKAKGGHDRIAFAIESLDVFAPLDLSADATPEDIQRAFRAKVKSMADGKGGYTGDMDQLVQAKEKALAYVQRNA